MRRYKDWFIAQWDHQTAWGTPTTDFDSYIDDVADRASQGGLLELSAACSAFRLQALVYDQAREQYIIMGTKDRIVIPLCFHDFHWSLIHRAVRLPDAETIRLNPAKWKRFDT
eukprot:2931224-Prorocentrum_lima.AAC.1